MNKKQWFNLIRIIISLIIFCVLVVLEHTKILDKLPALIHFTIFFIPYLFIGYEIFWKALRNIIRLNFFDENFLMTVATLAAFALGLFGEGEYPEALAVMLFYQIGEFFQDYALGKSRKSISELMSLSPDYANLKVDDSYKRVFPDEVAIGQTILVKPGEKVPLDGLVIHGESYIDVAALTGESRPIKVAPGEAIISGSVNGESALHIRTTKLFEDSTVAKILELVENASTKKANVENFISRFAKYYTPIVTVSAVLLALASPLLFGATAEAGIKRACNFLIVSCPCALVISVPLSFFAGIGYASKKGILVKGSQYMELASQIKTFVFDKTGTITKGEFKVQDVVLFDPTYDKAHILEIAAHAEIYSNHPIANSIRQEFARPLDSSRVSDVREISGRGISLKYCDEETLVGNGAFLKERGINIDETYSREGVQPKSVSDTIVYVALDNKCLGSITIADTIKEGVDEALAELKKNGVERLVMLTGDSSEIANKIANLLSIDEVRAELLPQEKVRELESLMCKRDAEAVDKKIAFVGDGINDAPVLMRSDVGFAMGSLGSDAAIEASDIVIMDDDLKKLAKVLSISKKNMGIVKANIGFAILVKLLILGLSVFGLASMWAAVFGDVGVSVLCIVNSMRLLGSRAA